MMWELSAPGGDAEGCFKRIHETEYFYDGRDARLNWMPDVRSSRPHPPLPLTPPSAVYSAHRGRAGPRRADRGVLHDGHLRRAALRRLPPRALRRARRHARARVRAARRRARGGRAGPLRARPRVRRAGRCARRVRGAGRAHAGGRRGRRDVPRARADRAPAGAVGRGRAHGEPRGGRRVDVRHPAAVRRGERIRSLCMCARHSRGRLDRRV